MAAPDLAGPSLFAESVASRRPKRYANSRELLTVANTVAEVSADFVAFALGYVVACVLGSSLSGEAKLLLSLRNSVAGGAILGLLAVVLAHREGGYGGGSGLLRIRDTERAMRISIQSLGLACIIELLMGQSLPWPGVLIAMVLIPVLLVLERQFLFAIVRHAQHRESRIGRAVIYGTGAKARSVVSTLLSSPRLGLRPAAVIDHTGQFGGSLSAFGYRNRCSIPVWSGPVTPGWLRSIQCDALLIATDEISEEERDVIFRAGLEAGCDVAQLAGCQLREQGEGAIDLDGLLFTSAAGRSTPWHYLIAKRIADVVLSTALLLMLGPLLLLIAILIRTDSPGRALFVQNRVGKNGRYFRILKFRTMYSDAQEYLPSPQSSSDPRITRIGRLLRRMSLDELPQLLNVLEGTMSLVGPRPEMPFIVERYNASIRTRLNVTPGITGLWQLSADRSFPIHENIDYDLYYIRNRGFFLDLAILAHTLMFAMTGGV